MRTGSNFLEESLNAVPGIACMGEAFNPVFIAYPNQSALLGMTMAERDARPLELLKRIRSVPGLPGFRYFPDHDPRVLDEILADTSCAKIILTRNPVESYVSLKIARETGQWKLNDARRLKSAQVSFDPAEFDAHLAEAQGFHLRMLHALQTSSQTAFYLDYEDIGDGAVLTGLVRFLGLKDAVAEPATSLVPQNPQALADKVANPGEMAAALAGFDRFNLSRTPNFEPRRGPSVPGFVAAKGAPLLFMPVRSGPTTRIEVWLSRFGADQAGIITGFSQSSLRDWMRGQGPHRRFTVLRHPVARAYVAFADMVMSGRYPDLTEQLARQYKIILPGGNREGKSATAAERDAFAQFLQFLKPNLNGQTSIRVDAAWASQLAILTGYGRLVPPDAVIREERLAEDLAQLCRGLGLDCPPLPDGPDPALAPLSAFYDDEIEALARQACQRDYLSFGFGPWRALP